MSNGNKKTKEEILEELRFSNKYNIDIYRNHRGDICGKKIYEEYDIEYFEYKEYLTDREFLLEAVKINGNILELVDEPLRYDRALLLAAAEHSDSLYWRIKLTEELLCDEEFMVQLLSKNGKFLYQLQYKLEPLTEREKKLIVAAVKNDYQSCEYVNFERIFESNPERRDFAFQLLDINANVLRYLGKKLRDDEEIVLYAAKYSYRSFEFASYRLRNDENFVLRVLEVNPSCLAFAPKKMREDRELVTRLMEKEPFVYRYAKGEMLKDATLAIQAIKAAPRLYEYLDSEMINNNAQFFEGIHEFVENENTPKEIREELKEYLNNNFGYYRWKENN